jgi:hypothetical protein
MNATSFPLTVNRKDLHTIYLGSKPFSLWDESIRLIWLYMFLLVAAGAMSSWRMVDHPDAFLFLFIAIIGVGICVIEIIKAYWKARKRYREIDAWIDTFVNTPGQEIIVDGERIRYRRADYESVHDFARVKNLYRLPAYFSLEIDKLDRLIIPVSAFAPGDADRFWEVARFALDHYLSRSAGHGLDPAPDPP